MSFLFPTLLTLGLPLIAVPVIIHLINLRRHRRIRWAAMDFLRGPRKAVWTIGDEDALLILCLAGRPSVGVNGAPTTVTQTAYIRN